MHKNRKVGIIGITITILVLIILVIFTNINITKFNIVENFFAKAFMPIQNGYTHLKNKLTKNNSFFEDVNNLKQENEKLVKENNKLKEELKTLEIIKAENATLRSYNNMSMQYSEYHTVPAYIINKDVSNLSNVVVINVGSKDGIIANMPVITTEGLVGYTISVTDKTAKVKLIIDASSNTSAQISTSRESIIARGVLRKFKHIKVIIYSNRCRISNWRYNRNFWNGWNISKRNSNW